MTDKERVLAKWPDAVARMNVLTENPNNYFFVLSPTELLGSGISVGEAWADAARRLEDGK